MADDLHGGQETEDNIKYLWEDEFMVPQPVKDFKIRNNAVYTLAGYFPNGEKFSYEIWNTTITDCITVTGKKMQFAVSKKLLRKTEKIVDAKKEETHLYFYLRDSLPMENPMNGVYLLEKDFPKELKNKVRK